MGPSKRFYRDVHLDSPIPHFILLYNNTLTLASGQRNLSQEVHTDLTVENLSNHNLNSINTEDFRHLTHRVIVLKILVWNVIQKKFH